MRLGPDEKALKMAGEQPKRRIREDRREKATARIKPLLTHIEDHLFDPGLTAASLLQACGVRDNTVASLFTRDVGKSPSRYIRERRMEAGSRLLVDTDLDVWRIADLLGYGHGGTFGRAFRQWAGSSPTDYRRSKRRAEAEAESQEHFLREMGRRLARGEAAELSVEDRTRLIDSLRSFEDPVPALAFGPADLERAVALSLWEKLQYRSPDEQRHLVRRPYGLSSPALFEVLLEKSREAGRRNRQDGVQLVETAIASLEGIAPHLTAEQSANLRARGLAWLGNALRLALDYPAAKRTFDRARETLPVEPDPFALAEVCTLEGELLLYQADYRRALKLKNRAVELFRSLDNDLALASVLVSRGWTLGQVEGAEAAIPDLLESLNLTDQPYVERAGRQTLMSLYVMSGRHAEAVEMITETRSLCEELGDPSLLHQLEWFEAFVQYSRGEWEAAKENILRSRQGFLALGEVRYVASASLDLAEISLKLGQPIEAVNYAVEAIPVFESFESYPEALAALNLLQDATVRNRIAMDAVLEIRGYLGHLLQESIGLRE